MALRGMGGPQSNSHVSTRSTYVEAEGFCARAVRVAPMARSEESSLVGVSAQSLPSFTVSDLLLTMVTIALVGLNMDTTPEEVRCVTRLRCPKSICTKVAARLL